MGKSSPSTPAPPDPVATANAQAAANKEAAYETARLNRINQITPYGSLTYENIGATPTQVGGSFQVGDKTFGTMEEALKFAGSEPLPNIKTSYKSFGDNRQAVYKVGNKTFYNLVAAQNYLNTLTPQSKVQQIGGGWEVGGQTYKKQEEVNAAARDLEQWQAVQTLTPEQQRILDIQNQASEQYGNIALNQLGQVGGLLSTPLDFSSLGAIPEINEQTRQSVYDSILARNQGQQDSDRQRLEQQLANMGFVAGSAGYDRKFDELNRSINDFRLAADTQALNQALALNQQQMGARNQALNEMIQQRQIPLNELAAMLSGTQVQQPSFVNTPQAQINPADVMGATYNSYAGQMNAYNQQLANQSAMQQGLMGGLFGLGSAGLGAYLGGAGAAAGGAAAPLVMGGALLSDRRTKENIVKVGKLDNGLNVYSFNYIGQNITQIGLMADEVEKVNPKAVLTMPNGIKAVYYDKAVRS
jgi:hypothetical protein